MFGITIPPGVDAIRIMALTGKQGKRPCLWEGYPNVSQQEIEAAIDSDLRVRRWLTKHRLIRDGTATLTLNIELYSQDRRVDTIEVKDVTLFIRHVKRKPRTTSDEVVIKSISALESTIQNLTTQLEKNWNTLAHQLDQRDTVIGKLVQRGLNPPVPPKQEAPPPPAPLGELDTLLNSGTKLFQMANMFKALKSRDD